MPKNSMQLKCSLFKALVTLNNDTINNIAMNEGLNPVHFSNGINNNCRLNPLHAKLVDDYVRVNVKNLKKVIQIIEEEKISLVELTKSNNNKFKN